MKIPNLEVAFVEENISKIKDFIEKHKTELQKEEVVLEKVKMGQKVTNKNNKKIKLSEPSSE